MSFHRNCQGATRRDCLRLGLGTALGAGFVDLLKLRGEANSSARVAARSCILIWLDGGPSHYETFDPKPMAPAEIRGEFFPIDTAVPGMQFSEQLPKLAAMADRLAIVRSIRHDQGNHGAGNHYMMTGAPPRIPVGCGAFVSFHPSLGAVTAQQRGNHGGLPAYFSMPQMSRSGGPNFLGAQYAPFVVPNDPNSKNFRVRDVALPKGLEADRFDRRRALRTEVDQLPRFLAQAAGDPVLAVDNYVQQSYDLMASAEAQAALDIHREDDTVRERYGRNSFGQRALLARRLVEAGVPFITLYDGGWDHHRGLFASCRKQLPELDQTVAALIGDLSERGLLDETLIVVLGEFGRTPKINSDGGRDHWSNAMSVLFAGGRTPGGIVVGATDPQGYSAVDRVCSPENFASTIYTKLGIDPHTVLYTPQGRPAHIVSDPAPIAELMG